MGAKIILVANGGLGNSFDELELNRTLCQKKGVSLAGVIINKVRPDKYEQTRHYITKALQQKWGRDGDDIPLLGCIPDRPFLGCPALADLERLFDASLVSGKEHRLRHYRISDLTLVATSLEVFLKQLRKNRLAKQRTLYVCHASRNDILLGYLMESVQRHQQQKHHHHSSATTTLSSESDIENFDSAMIVTGCEEYPMSTQVLEIVTGLPASAPPVLLTQQRTDAVMQGIYQYTPKLNREDPHRVGSAVEHYQPYINFDLLLERLAIPPEADSTVPLAATK
jgi:BioD-like phosphotransacetylase family protein